MANRPRRRLSEAIQALIDGKLRLDALPSDLRSAVLEAIGSASDLEEKPEHRMRKTIDAAARNIGLVWVDDYPADHPYARLDGELLQGNKRVAIVELEARTPKQIRGALLDLLVHPEPCKILVIGMSRAVTDTAKAKKHILERVLPVLQSEIKRSVRFGVFTENELRQKPSVISDYLASFAASKES